MFTVGPGDVTSVYADWKSNQKTLSQTAITYSSLSMDFVREIRGKCIIASYYPESSDIIDDNFRIANIKKISFKNNTGFWYHSSEIIYSLQLSWLAYKNDVAVIIVDSGTSHWFVWSIAALAGMKIIPNFHNTYYPIGKPASKRIRKIIQYLDHLFFRKFTKVAIGVSPECGKQYLELTQPTQSTDHPKQFFGYFAQFIEKDFSTIKPVDAKKPCLNVMYAGRIEENKGALDLVDIAVLLKKRNHEFTITVCGEGHALPALKERIAAANLERVIELRGMLSRPALLRAYEDAQIVIIPTRSTFAEGLPRTCAEAALAGRALVTSKMSNALEIFPGAIMEAVPDQIESYADALERLFNDRALLQHSAARLQAMAGIFTDPKNSLQAVLHRALPHA